MAYFDFLIDKDNKTPKTDMEYIYRHNLVWKRNTMKSFPISKGTIVTNVIRLDSGAYEFTIKGTDEVLTTVYGWSLAENTEENVKKINFYDKEYAKFKAYEKIIHQYYDDITTL